MSCFLAFCTDYIQHKSEIKNFQQVTEKDKESLSVCGNNVKPQNKPVSKYTLRPAWKNMSLVSKNISIPVKLNEKKATAGGVVIVVIDEKSELYFIDSVDLNKRGIAYGGLFDGKEQHIGQQQEFLEETAGYFEENKKEVTLDPDVGRVYQAVQNTLSKSGNWSQNYIDTDFVKAFFWIDNAYNKKLREGVIFIPLKSLGKVDDKTLTTLNEQEKKLKDRSFSYHERKDFKLIPIKNAYNLIQGGRWPKEWRSSGMPNVMNKNLWYAISQFLGKNKSTWITKDFGAISAAAA